MRLLLDEPIGPDVAVGLRARGHDVTSVIEAGLRTEDDPVLWQHAIAAGQAMVTYNRDDFLSLAVATFQEGRNHAGLVILSAKTIPQADIGALVRALGQLLTSGEDIGDQILFLTRAP